MSAITLINNAKKVPEEVSEKLTVSESNVAAVAVSSEGNPRIGDMDTKQIARIVTAITLKSAARLGSKAKDLQDQKLINAELNRDLVLKFPTKTEREIMLALENGLDGLYLRKPDDPIIFNPSNFAQWVRAFEVQTKRPVMAKISSMSPPKDVEWQIPESEQLKMSLDYFKSILKRTLDGEAYEDFGNVLYAFLDKIGFMLVPAEDKWKALDMAKLHVIAEAKEREGLMEQRKAVQKALESLQRAETEGPDEVIISTAKRILISQKLQAFKAMPVDEQADMIEAVEERVDYMCIELKNPEQYAGAPQQ